MNMLRSYIKLESPKKASQNRIGILNLRRGRAGHESLEGSRFRACLETWRYLALHLLRPENVKAGGSRELPSAVL